MVNGDLQTNPFAHCDLIGALPRYRSVTILPMSIWDLASFAAMLDHLPSFGERPETLGLRLLLWLSGPQSENGRSLIRVSLPPESCEFGIVQNQLRVESLMGREWLDRGSRLNQDPIDLCAQEIPEHP
jgi:hypothetical protein